METGHFRAEVETVGRPIGLCNAMLAGVASSREPGDGFAQCRAGSMPVACAFPKMGI